MVLVGATDDPLITDDLYLLIRASRTSRGEDRGGTSQDRYRSCADTNQMTEVSTPRVMGMRYLDQTSQGTCPSQGTDEGKKQAIICLYIPCENQYCNIIDAEAAPTYLSRVLIQRSV